ncbi:MAG TPA: plastocyanin/azurin family copper-binding protein [Caulobacteraceae bacterium]|jgi:plastocyanin|nr:plastocyanin/azurin family copper-binding protein [Caulobacteraceae bacterium]
MNRRSVPLKQWAPILATALLIPIAALASDAGLVVVDQHKLQFSLSTVTMRVGDRLRFDNSDRVNHNVLISLGGVRTNSGLQKPGEPFEVPMLRAGVYQVTCGIHPRMRMTVIVEQ